MSAGCSTNAGWRRPLAARILPEVRLQGIHPAHPRQHRYRYVLEDPNAASFPYLPVTCLLFLIARLAAVFLPTTVPPSATPTHGAGKQARKIGASIHAAVATVHRVLTCQWCRCRDTASVLDFGSVEHLPALNSLFRNRNAGTMSDAKIRRAYMAGARAPNPHSRPSRLQSER